MADKITYRLDVDDKGTPKVTKFGDASEKAGKKSAKAFDEAGDSLSDAASKIPGLGAAMDVLSAGPIAGASIAVVGLAAGFGAMVMSSIDMADSMNDLSLRLGISTERLSVLSLYAEQSGTDIDSLASAMGKLGAKIANGDKGLKAYGVTAGSADEALFQLADKIESTADPMVRLKIATDAFGKSGQQMMPLLVQGGAALREMGGNAAIVTTEMAKMSDEFNDKMAEMKSQFAASGLALADAWLPTLTKILDLSAQIGTALLGDDLKNAEMGAKNWGDEAAKLQRKLAGGGLSSWGSVTTKSELKAALLKAKEYQSAVDRIKARNATGPSAHGSPAPAPGGGYDSAEEITARAKAAADAQTEARIAEAKRNTDARAYADRLQSEEADRRDKAASAYRDNYEKEMAVDQEAHKKSEAEVEAHNARLLEANRWLEDGRREMNEEAEAEMARTTAARNAAIAQSFAPLQSTLQQFSTDLLNGEASMASFGDSFKAMLVGMAAEVMANAAIFALLNVVSGGAAGAFLGGLGGLSSLILGSFAVGTRSLDDTGPIIAHKGEAIFPAPVTAAMADGDWGPAVRFMGQGGGSVATTNNITIQVTGAQAMDYKAMGKVLQRATEWQGRTRAKGSR